MRFLPVLAAFLLAACATATGPDAASRFDAFEGQANAVARFDRVFIAPVSVSPEVQARTDLRSAVIGRRDARALGERDIARNTAALRDALRSELGEVATLADAPGPGVLTVALTIDALDANRPTMAEQRANPALSFQSISIGGAGVTGELREDGVVLARFEDANVPARITDPLIGAGMWVEADRYYRQLADKLSALLR